jgi:hypothetical protein
MADSNDPSLTPEKRLLELIEEPGAHKQEVTAATRKKGLKDFFSVAALQEKFASFKGQGGAFLKKNKKSFGIKDLNKVLRVVVGLMVLIFGVNLALDLSSLKQDFAKSIQVRTSQMFETEAAKENATEGTAVEQWDLGKMFMPYGKRQEEANKLQKEQSSRLDEMIKKLKLTGISYNPAEPQSAFCMIEDVEKNITTFLHVGDPVGLLKVGKINEDFVVLEQGNETVELR